jgi:hypothetical protein
MKIPSTSQNENHFHIKKPVSPIVVQISRQYKTPLTKFQFVFPLYDFIPDSIADCNSSSNFRNLIRAPDFQSSSLQNVFEAFYVFECFVVIRTIAACSMEMRKKVIKRH